ncbi:hypothetical protein [Actinoplanes sp. NPDC048796]|uniref:hypothetical protein n=1 Tax=Actinoplanes sp. NPDC048796 TaxID=3155640 RepID=UPI0033D832F5
MIPLLAATPPEPATKAIEYVISPTGVAVLLLLGLVVDYMSVGPDSLRDRLAFLLAVPAFHDGFDGSPADRWTVQQLSNLIGYLLEQTGGARIAGASINTLVGAGVGILFIYTVGCLLPVKASKKLGRFATLTFPKTSVFRINWRLWACAFLLGVLCDLAQGLVGDLTNGAVSMLVGIVQPLPMTLFGAA